MVVKKAVGKADMRYPSAKDKWIKLIIFPSIGILAGSAFIVPQEFILLTFIGIMPIVLFLTWIYFGTYYELFEDYLLCKSGPFREKIGYENIKSVKPTQNMLSSMALSSKRIEIRQHGKNFIMRTALISPETGRSFWRS